MYVFTYGSLLDPTSLRRTLPEARLEDCIPARCSGYRRVFSVAFPNDGSQPDKRYYRGDGSTPPTVLACNIIEADTPVPEGSTDAVEPSVPAVNGVCLPVTAADVVALKERELRYGFHDVTERVSAYDPSIVPGRPIFSFVGEPRFSGPDQILAGVVSKAYVAGVEAGARFWDTHCPGFWDDYVTTTEQPPVDRVEELTRVDY